MKNPRIKPYAFFYFAEKQKKWEKQKTRRDEKLKKERESLLKKLMDILASESRTVGQIFGFPLFIDSLRKSLTDLLLYGQIVFESFFNPFEHSNEKELKRIQRAARILNNLLDGLIEIHVDTDIHPMKNVGGRCVDVTVKTVAPNGIDENKI